MDIYKVTFSNQNESQKELFKPIYIHYQGQRGETGTQMDRRGVRQPAAGVLSAFLPPIQSLTGCLPPTDALIVRPAKAEACPS